MANSLAIRAAKGLALAATAATLCGATATAARPVVFVGHPAPRVVVGVGFPAPVYPAPYYGYGYGYGYGYAPVVVGGGYYRPWGWYGGRWGYRPAYVGHWGGGRFYGHPAYRAGGYHYHR